MLVLNHPIRAWRSTPRNCGGPNFTRASRFIDRVRYLLDRPVGPVGWRRYLDWRKFPPSSANDYGRS
jgi:hypothetical protein